MKTKVLKVALALLCLNAKSVAQMNRAVDVVTQGLQVGQQVPDLQLGNLYNYKTKTAPISSFKGKLLILDFWATWCAPCVDMIPEMDSLQRMFGDSVQFLSVTYQTEKEVLPFLAKMEKQKARQYNLVHLLADKELHALFPHVYLPHYVWINGEGIIKAITGHQQVTAGNIRMMLQGQTDMDQKKDITIPFDPSKPYLINGNGGDGANLIYHAVLTSYAEGLTGGYTLEMIDQGKEGKISARNLTIPDLYRLAYGGADKVYYGRNRLVLNVNDTAGLAPRNLSGNAFIDWMRKGNAFCYELIVPPQQIKQAYELMRNDLDRAFYNYTVTKEKRKQKCLVLKQMPGEDNIKSAGGKTIDEFSPFGCTMRNSTLKQFIGYLSVIYLQKSPYPVINGTGYKGFIDMDIKANLNNVPEVNKALEKYHLRFEEKDMDIDMIVVRDRK